MRQSDRSNALHGNAALDALRPLKSRDAERHMMHSHAERGNDLYEAGKANKKARIARAFYVQRIINPPPTPE